jgi:hypothetical protein
MSSPFHVGAQLVQTRLAHEPLCGLLFIDFSSGDWLRWKSRHFFPRQECEPCAA